MPCQQLQREPPGSAFPDQLDQAVLGCNTIESRGWAANPEATNTGLELELRLTDGFAGMFQLIKIQRRRAV